MKFSLILMKGLMVGTLAFGMMETAQASKRALPDQGSAESSSKRHKGEDRDSTQATATPSISYANLVKIFKETPNRITQDPALQHALVGYKYNMISFLKASEIFKGIPLDSLKEKVVQEYRYAYLVACALKEDPSLDLGGLSECVLQFIQSQAAQKNREAEHLLGCVYEFGLLKMTQDKSKALEYYQAAADQGLALAQHTLGMCYETGNGVPQDLATAIKYYQAAADQGFAQAHYKLGWCYQNGLGVEKDFAKAFQNFQAAADQGLVSAQNNLGWCYETGKGVEKDLAKAGWLYLQSAQQGILPAKQAFKNLLTIPPVNPHLTPLIPYKISEDLNQAYESIMATLSFLEVQNNSTSGDQKIRRFAVKPTYESVQTLSKTLQEIYEAVGKKGLLDDMSTLLLISPQQGTPRDPDWKDTYVWLNNAWYCTLNPATQEIAKTIESLQEVDGVQETIEVKQNALKKIWRDLETSQTTANVLPKESPALETLGQKHDLLTKTYDKLSKNLEELQDCQANFEKFSERLLLEIQTTASSRGSKLWEIVQDNPNPPQQ